MMTEHTEIFEIVLCYTRKAVVKPSEPEFEAIQKSNPKLDIDNVLDIYSELKNKYKADLAKYEINKSDVIISDFILILEDENFMKKVKDFEKNNFFIEWEKSSKKIINETIVNILK